MKYLAFLLTILLFSCGPKGDKSKHTPPPMPETMVLVGFEPLEGYHIPLTQYFTYKENKFLSIYFGGEVINTTSWVTFLGSHVGKKLIGALFKNGEVGKEFYLWFKVQMTPMETAEYTLELYRAGPFLRGYEMLKIGEQPKSVIKVSYTIIPPPPPLTTYPPK